MNLTRAVLVPLLLLAAPGPALAAAPGTTILVSRPAAFGPLATPTTNDSVVTFADDASARVVADADNHRYIAFVSLADGLSPDDDDRVANVYVRDTALNVTHLVSRADGPAGAGANGESSAPSISADGRFVAFTSSASNLAAGAGGETTHVYVRDLVSGTTRLADRADGPDGAIANDSSFEPSLTAEGGQPVVAFTSVATNLDGGTNSRLQVYVRDLGSDDTQMESRSNATNLAGNGSSASPSISTDATGVAFESDATNLVGGDGNARSDVFVRTLTGSSTVMASNDGLTLGNDDATDPSLSGDGGRVAFVSRSTNTADGDTDSQPDVHVRDLSDPGPVLVSRASGAAGAKADDDAGQPSITDDGNAVAFTSQATNLVAADDNAAADVFVRTGVFSTGTTSLVTRPENGALGDGASAHASIARNPSGTNTFRVAFTTVADNMGADDEDDFTQVYVRRIGLLIPPNPAVLISRPTGGGPFRSGVNASHLRAQTRSTEPVDSMSADGRYTVFLSDADELSAEDDNRFTNVFRRDNLTGATLLVSRADGADGEAANATSAVHGGGLTIGPSLANGAPAISADGNRIAFATGATNLVPGDGPGGDVFVRDVAAGTTVLASRKPDGSAIPVTSGDPALSGDGTRVAFVTTEQMDGDTNNDADVYLRDLAAGTTQLVSRRGPAGPVGNDASTQPAIDFDGSHVAFQSDADDLDPPVTDLNGDSDVLLRDVTAGQTTTVSRNQGGDATPDDPSFAPSLDDDGNRVAFASRGTNLVSAALDVNGGATDVFVRDVAAATTVLASRTAAAPGLSGNNGSERPSISGSGTRIAFETFASDLISGDANGTIDVAVWDTAAQTLALASRANGAQLAEGGATPAISGNGDCVAFDTRADDMAGMPPGTDHGRVAAAALRGDCPFGPVGAGPGPPPPPPPPPATDTTAPTLTNVRLKPKRFRAGARVRKKTRKRPAVGARLRLELSEAATVRVRVDALKPGRRKGGRCVKPRPGLRGKRCKRRKQRGVLTFTGAAGLNRFAFTGTVNGRRLKAGRHRLRITATDAAANAAAPVRRPFTVLPRR